MMELTTCAFVVTLVSLVTATPYGYGVKGGAGASARAESSASAGAFGGQGNIPVAIPFGNGFSGSFSKSSSSSSASSSSSSSSSSFSYSGSGSGGFSAQGTHDKIGCTSGPCQNSGGNEILENHGATNAGLGVHGFNTANAAAVAGSGLISGTECNGPTCDGNSGKCLSGKCQPKPQTENGYDNSKKCTSGQCGSPSETGPSAATNDDSDDIRFVAHSSKAAHDSKDQSADHDKLTGYSAGSDCRGGNCGTTTSYNSQPNTVHGAPNSYQHSKPSSFPQSTNLNTGSSPGYHTPATDLETPKYDSNCKSGICNSGQSEPVHGTSPSSYNVPIHGCNTPNCVGSSPTSGVTPAVTAQPGSYGIHKESGNVPIATDKTPSYTAGFGGPAGMLKPDAFDIKVTNKPVHSSTLSYQNHPQIPTTGCKTPNCNGYAPVAGANAAANAQSGLYGAAKPSSGVDSSSELPPYTGGFGGPTGVLKPNEFGLPHSAPNSNIPNYSNTLPNNAPTSNNLSGCTTANCYPSNLGSTTATHPQSPFGAIQPSITSHQSGVTSSGYTSNFARPVGIANPTAPAVAPISPTYTNTQPLHTTAIHSEGCKTGNCGGHTTSAGFPNDVQPSGSYGPANPNTEPKPYNPQYTAGFGSPSGTVTPNDHSYNVPSASSSAINCKTANCANVPSAGAGTNAQSDFIADTKEQLPAFSSGFGAPAGSFKPNDYSIPAAGTAPNEHNKPSSVASSPGACAAGNCDPKVTLPSSPGYNSAPSGSHYSSNPYNPQYTGGFGVPAGTATPDDYSHNLPSAGSSSVHCNTPNCANPAPTTAGANAQSGYNVGPKEQLPAYTSGFGAPAGLYKPNDHSIPDVGTAPIDLNKPSAPGACSSGNCNPKVTSPSSPGYNSAPSSTLPSSQSSNPQYTGNFGSPSGTGSPNDHTYNVPSAASSSIPCKTSNCANPPTANAGANAQSASHAGSKEQLPAYTGGFGAPGGFLKPNDNSIPAVGAAPNVHNKPSPATTALGACSSGNCNSKVPSSSSPGYNPTFSGAHASASSVASAVAYTGGFGGPPGVLKPNDDGKIDLTKIVGGQNQGSHHGAGNIHSPHDLFNASTAGKAGAHSSAGATAYSGSLTSASSGLYGFNTHGAHQAGGVKGTSPCGGGCSGGYQDGLNGGASSAGAVARSHSSSGAFGIGGSFASSSASAHSSAGAYTKGGYGKR